MIPRRAYLAFFPDDVAVLARGAGRALCAALFIGRIAFRTIRTRSGALTRAYFALVALMARRHVRLVSELARKALEA